MGLLARAALAGGLAVVLVGCTGGSSDSSERRYCASLRILSGGGMIDEHGKSLSGDWDERDKRDAYRYVAQQAPSAELATAWRAVADLMVAQGAAVFDSLGDQQFALADRKERCGISKRTTL